MFNTLMRKSNTEENTKKDLKKLAMYVKHAKGQERTINGFSADCHVNPEIIANIINGKVSSYPPIPLLKIIADNSNGRVSLNDLKIACGYSLYENNDIEQIRNLHIRRGDFYWANFGDNCMDSEQGGNRIVLIIQNNLGNSKSTTTVAIPVTTRRTKSKMITHVDATSKDCGLPNDSIICCEQIRCISKRRLTQNGILNKIAECPENVMLRVSIALMKSEGSLELHVSEEEAIEDLKNMNKVKPIRQNIQENNYVPNHNYNSNPIYQPQRVAFAR